MTDSAPGRAITTAEARYRGWVDAHATELYRFAYRMTGRAEIAEDLTQETFYHAWRSMKSLRDPSRARAWLYQILRYRYAHWLRDKGRQIKAAGPDALEANPPSHDERTLEKLSLSESLRLALDELDDRFRTPFLMVYLEGLSCRETAEQLGVPLGTVLSRTHRARQAMRQALDAQRRAAEAPGDAARLKLRGAG